MIKYALGMAILVSSMAMSAMGQTARPIDKMFYSEPYSVVERGIFEASRRHAIYSYIISNMSTPGFDAMRYLPPDDQAELQSIIPSKQYTRDILLEFVVTKMSDNNRRDTALMTMWKNKKDSLQRIVTMGK
jgi:hypothetical protein